MSDAAQLLAVAMTCGIVVLICFGTERLVRHTLQRRAVRAVDRRGRRGLYATWDAVSFLHCAALKSTLSL